MASANGVLGPGLLALVGGVVLLAWALASGDAELHLVVVVPVISGTGAVFAGGVLLLMLGLVITFLGLSLRHAGGIAGGPGDELPTPTRDGQPPRAGTPPASGGAEFGGVVFIGPIPIIFGRGQRPGGWMLVASIVFGVLLIVFILGLLL